jgi:hypothetical protein
VQVETGPLHRFRDWPNDLVPKRAAGVYTVWESDRLLYVGMSGRAMTAEDLEVSEGGRVVAKGLWTRLNSHASGRRSGDQFCVYVGDRFVVPGPYSIPAATAGRRHLVARQPHPSVRSRAIGLPVRHRR